jgi:hypothetical protein
VLAKGSYEECNGCWAKQQQGAGNNPLSPPYFKGEKEVNNLYLMIGQSGYKEVREWQ